VAEADKAAAWPAAWPELDSPSGISSGISDWPRPVHGITLLGAYLQRLVFRMLVISFADRKSEEL
jgi:hypothetical protein